MAAGKGSLDGIQNMFMYIPKRPAQEIVTEHLKAWDYLYEPSRFLSRTYRYFMELGSPPPASSNIARDPLWPRDLQSLKSRGRDLLMLLILSWTRGVFAPQRKQYWRQFVDLYRKRIANFPHYIETLLIGEDMFHFRQSLRHPEP
jgi:hypothetical protein